MSMFGAPMGALGLFPGMLGLDQFGAVSPAVAAAVGAPTPTAMRAPGGPLNQGPGGPLVDSGPSAIRVTDPSRYSGALRMGAPDSPSAVGGGNPVMPAIAQAPSVVGSAPGGMFGGKAKQSALQRFGPMIAAMLVAMNARRNPLAATELQGMLENLSYQRKKTDADAQTAQYVQALVANGMDPNLATIMAADPAEMAKHIGTRFDAQRVDEGSSVLTPNLNGTSNVFTAPKTFKEGADVVQAPGAQTVAPDFSTLGAVGVPNPLGGPVSIPGLRTEGQQYASQFGDVGSPAYSGALQDYTLKGNGPTAFGFDQTLQNGRLAAQRSIAAGHDATSRANNQYSVDHRIGGRAGGQPKPPTPQTVIGGIMDKQARGEPLTPAEQGALRDYRTHYKPQRGAVQISGNEPVATDAHGNKIVVRNGRWVNAATGQPVQ